MNLSKHRRRVFMLAAGGLLALVMIILASQPGRAAGPWYVSPDGDDSNSCTSPGAACATINGARAKATSGDTIYVAIGTYTGYGDQVVLLTKSITLSGGWDASFSLQSGSSTIDGEGVRRGLTVNQSVIAVVEHFTIQNCTAYSGGGISSEGTLSLSHSTVTGNRAVWAGGGILSRGSLSLSNCTFSANEASWDGGGGGISHEGGTTTVINSTISDNTEGGVSIDGGAVTMDNTTVSGNSGFDGGGIVKGYGTLTLSNCTVTGNASDSTGGGINFWNAGVTLQNTILAGNTAESGPDCWGAYDTIVSAGYNLVGDTSGCDFSPGNGDLTNISPNLGPLIGLPGYHPLSHTSPAIDAGNPAGCTDHQGDLLDTDQRGAARVGTCDIGSYEYTTPGPADSISAVSGTPQRKPPFLTFDLPFLALVLDAIGTPVRDATATFSAPATGASGTFADSGTRTTTAQTDEFGMVTAAAFTANGERGSYTVAATVGGVPAPANYLLTNIGWYVSHAGNDANDCQIPTAPCATISGPLSKADFVAGDTVLVASGQYTGQGDEVVRLDKKVRLLGGWNTTFSVQSGVSAIDGEASRRGLTVDESVTAVLDRFSIRNGLGGIANDGTLSLTNCTVSGNAAWSGGGIANGYNGKLTIWNCSITANTADYRGGGVNNSGIMDLNNSTISDNSGEYGGGIANGGCLTLNNCTVTRNMANGAGGIYWHGGSITLQNSILADNALPTGTDCYGRVTSLGYTLIANATGCDLTPGEGDLIGFSPRLGPLIGSPRYHPLRPDSPAIDAGNPDGCTDHLGNPLTTDQRGTARPLDGDGDGDAVCDMGAYEHDPQHPIVEIYLPVIARED